MVDKTRVTEMSSSSKYIIGLFLGFLIGVAGTYFYVSPKPNDWERMARDFEDEKQENRHLSEQVDELLDDLEKANYDYDELLDDFEKVNDDYRDLLSEYNSLTSEYQQVQSDYKFAQENWDSLSQDVYDFYNELKTHTDVVESFPRIFSDEELEKISLKVNSVTREDPDLWDGVNYIHQYVRDEIEYAYDAEFPLIKSYSYFGDKNSPRICDFDTSLRQNVLQSLSFTVEYEQGDCDDQAMLEFAMIKYYERYILEEEYALYLVRIVFENGDSHLAIFLPVAGGNICVLDPAGNYQTGSYSRLGSEGIRAELYDYQGIWEDENGVISEITLWILDIDTGDYSEVFKGSLSQTIEYLENR